jgi:hypothetical protein
MQRQVTHPAGTFTACHECKREPRHVAVDGRTNREAGQPGALLLQVRQVRHRLSCGCGRSTGLAPTLEAAVIDWDNRYSQIQLDLAPPTRSRVVSMSRRTRTPRKEAARG